MATARILVRSEQSGLTFTIEGATALRDAIGHDLLAAFLKCFHGVDRLPTLEQMWHFNTKCLDGESVAYSRNLRQIVNFLASTCYELGAALQELNHARVVDAMTDRSRWEPVNGWRKKLTNDAGIREIRNQLGFHLGKTELYRSGLTTALDRGEEHVFEVSDGPHRFEGECVLATEVLVTSLSIADPTELDRIITLTQGAHTDLPDLLMEVWKDVMDTAGVEVVVVGETA